MLMMLPFEAPTVFEGIHKSYFRMPRVVRDQRQRFENDDLFRQLSHESAVKYTGFKDRPLEERQMKFITNCQEGHTEVSVVQSGNQFTLMFNPAANPAYNNEGCDFDKELGKVHIKAGFILNGVCVLWRGWIDLQRLEGFGCLEYDEYRAYLEDAMVKQQIDKQQLCNNGHGGAAASNGAMPPPPPPIRLNHQPIGPPPPPMDHAAAAAAAVAAVTTNSMLPGAPPQLGLSGPPPHPPPPVSLADSTAAAAAAAAHYGNAAIAAAAAAAFHQALQVNGQSDGINQVAPPPPHPLQPHAQYSNAGAALASMVGLHGGSANSNNTLPYTHHSNSGSPPHSNIQHTIQHNTISSKSPERENHSTKEHVTSKRQHNNNNHAIKRQHEDSQQIPTTQQQQDQMTQQLAIDEQNASSGADHLVDVVSDISTHDLDLISAANNRRAPTTTTTQIFKSAESIHHNHHNHHHHHHQHKISRRA